MPEETQNNFNSRVTALETDVNDMKGAINRLIDINFEQRQWNRDTMANIDRLAQTVQVLAERADERLTRLEDSVIRLNDSMAQISTTNARLEESNRSIQAAVDRFDQILDYLIRRDGERN